MELNGAEFHGQKVTMELKEKEDRRKKKQTCKYFLRDKCTRENCSFGHERPYCKYFNSGKCKYGNDCFYLHKLISKKANNRMCKYFSKGSECPYREECRYPCYKDEKLHENNGRISDNKMEDKKDKKELSQNEKESLTDFLWKRMEGKIEQYTNQMINQIRGQVPFHTFHPTFQTVQTPRFAPPPHLFLQPVR